MTTNRKQLLDIVKKMTYLERKDWVYDHVNIEWISDMISEMSDEEVNDELNSMK